MTLRYRADVMHVLAWLAAEAGQLSVAAWVRSKLEPEIRAGRDAMKKMGIAPPARS